MGEFFSEIAITASSTWFSNACFNHAHFTQTRVSRARLFFFLLYLIARGMRTVTFLQIENSCPFLLPLSLSLFYSTNVTSLTMHLPSKRKIKLKEKKKKTFYIANSHSNSWQTRIVPAILVIIQCKVSKRRKKELIMIHLLILLMKKIYAAILYYCFFATIL